MLPIDPLAESNSARNASPSRKADTSVSKTIASKADDNDSTEEVVRMQVTSATPLLIPPGATGIIAGVPPASRVPRELVEHPRYQIVSLLGVGGMGTVYKARHRLMDRIVALKVVSPHLVNNPKMVRRFRQEVTAAARMDHPNIVRAFDADQAGNFHFLVMEFVDGVPLDRVLAERGRLSIGEACEYARQAAVGLQYAFERGMVHRDIKPHNLMLTATNQVKILDFGLARYVSEAAFEPELADDSESSAVNLMAVGRDVHEAGTVIRNVRRDGLTTAYVAMGTADYMAPEEGMDARGADIRADIYSLGCTLFHMLTGRVPFPGDNMLEKLHRHLNDPLPELRELRDDVPVALATTVEQMLAKDPAARHQTPAEVAASLAALTVPMERRILLVEDDETIRADLAAALRARGFAVDLAENGSDALERLRSGPRPALIVVDLIMPVMNGWDFLRVKREDPGLASIPVVIVSATDPERDLAVALGAADYVRKPFAPDQLAHRVAELATR